MRSCSLIISICFVFTLSGFGQVVNLNSLFKTDKDLLDLKTVSERPDLAANVLNAAKLKILSRKQQYHLGEMLILDVALLNTMDKKAFFPVLTHLKIDVKNSQGKSIFYNFDAGDIRVPGFNLIPSKDYDHQSYMLLVKCDSKTLTRINLLNSSDNTESFEKDLFLSSGNACINTDEPDELTISLEIKNEDVVELSNYPTTKTAVGKITSNELKIKIIK